MISKEQLEAFRQLEDGHNQKIGDKEGFGQVPMMMITIIMMIMMMMVSFSC